MSNKFLFTPSPSGKTINIPIEIKWDFDGKDDSIELYENDVIEDIIGEPIDFEILRFAHSEYNVTNPNRIKTDINYEFYFYTGNPTYVSATTSADINLWPNSYLPTFTSTEIYFFNKPFSKSFFKIDFYDTDNSLTQTNYFTIIIPTQQGETQSAVVSPNQPILRIKRPKFKLDYLGDKEGFFIYWLRKRDFLNINNFYMTAKFFDAKIGVFVPMINESQANIIGNKFNFTNPTDYFYYKVELDYNLKTYKVFKNNNRVGIDGNSIKWYEYVNPQ